MRTLIGIVGYRNLSDLSVGPNVLDDLLSATWGPGVDIDDLSYGPIAVVQNLEDRPPYDCMIFVGAAVRGRAPGQLYRYNWDHRLPSAEDIQARFCEAVTGVISLENLLIIAEYFNVLAARVIVFEIEPLECECGEKMSQEVNRIMPELVNMVRLEVDAGSGRN